MSRMSVVGGASASQENRHTNRESFSSKCDEKVLAVRNPSCLLHPCAGRKWIS
ncbi:hypothetical protein MGG_16797 [Pyricularia oryzae 70-15]|uniref:Uncharacterized protein n=1 Tax=Pyricularia oryzae (strain 70-15 / ATCC MYA-4617 / FGSC 8958) TaxID=242507 RepID=G4N1R6_PYRO7|nr:uncharacterized protein MGG_16797 [Pyricularia oryzae 70-15]EHA52431.1 hypothetical protein MGG_16797 [Pyricularia oryzae 70-15]